ncbi:MAG TPA: 16S rRNA (guanine(527)-N(7))-methyltransferase RsmG [Chitinophagaceae bacterium]|nr:16S rRNA (guanine(527)-N(7))-methyltransferase RsmG [Chitinophagaceae bacterium]
MDIILKYFTDFTEKQLTQFSLLDKLYKEWNQKINVISRKDIGSLYEKHVLHSLAIAAVFDQLNNGFKPGMEIIDIGTGGGFPGIPLAIYFHEIKFHLVDSIAKKLKVVEAIASETGLKNISTQHIRAEEIKNKKFDYAVTRAVAPLKDLWSWSKPLLKKNKSLLPVNDEQLNFQSGLICLKGGDLASEIQESGTQPRIIEIHNLFKEPFFKEKHLLFVPF